MIPDGASFGDVLTARASVPINIEKVLGIAPPSLTAPPDPPDSRAELIRLRLDEQRLAELQAKDDAERLARLRVKELRGSLFEFMKEAWKVLHPADPLVIGPHHEALCDHIQWMLEEWLRTKEDDSYVQPIRQLALSLPPTTLKTEALMVFAPVWMWLRCPSWRVLCVSCNPRVALDSAVMSRRVVESPWYQETFKPTWRLLDDQNAKSNYGTTEGGARESQGIGSTVVGQHASAIFVDDPTDPKNVTRAALNEANSDWPSLSNRVTDVRTSIRVILQQRLDVDDLIGFVSRGEKGKRWVRLVLPMEFVKKKRCATIMPVDERNRLCMDPARVRGAWKDWRSEEGELIQPCRYTAEIIEDLKITAGPYGWASQYQQDPVPRDGGRVKRSWLTSFRLSDHTAGTHARPDGIGPFSPDKSEPGEAYVVRQNATRTGWDLDWIYLSLDPASKKTDRGSLWGLLGVGGKGARRFVLDDRSKRGEWDEILGIIIEMIVEWRPARLLVEDTAAGPTIIKALNDELAAGKIRGRDGRPVICKVQVLTPAEVGGDKESRLDGVINQIAAGLLYVLEGALWAAEFVDELTMFPNYPTKDRVDALTALLAVARFEDAMWPELRAERARADAIAMGEEVPPEQPIEAKLAHLWLGVPLVGRAIDISTGKPSTDCQHEYINGRCRFECGK